MKDNVIQDALMYVVNMFYHWLIKELTWPIARQNRVSRGKPNRYREKEGRVREAPAVSGEARCEVTSHEPRGKI